MAFKSFNGRPLTGISGDLFKVTDTSAAVSGGGNVEHLNGTTGIGGNAIGRILNWSRGESFGRNSIIPSKGGDVDVVTKQQLIETCNFTWIPLSLSTDDIAKSLAAILRAGDLVVFRGMTESSGVGDDDTWLVDSLTEAPSIEGNKSFSVSCSRYERANLLEIPES